MHPYPWPLDYQKSLDRWISIAPWNTAVGASVSLAKIALERTNEDMPRKAIDVHPSRLTIQVTAMDKLYIVYSLKPGHRPGSLVS